ncbi:MAG: hypothetical protein IJQ50_05415 [Clostridia bacterium]|nr:hypothetical protein [Clostridia bacterium]
MRNKGRIVISILIAAITAITFVLGSMVFRSNLKQTKQNTIGVELADFIYNTEYSMRFGKQIETFYGMDDLLETEKNQFSDIQDIYIVSDNNSILFKTASEEPAAQICSITAGENISSENSLYCMYELSSNARIMVRTNQQDIIDKMKDYISNTAIKASIGLALSLLVVLSFSFIIKKEKTASIFAAVILISWTVVFGTMIGIDGYKAYNKSLNTVYDSIEFSINSDFERLEVLGVERINNVEEYLKRYTDMIPEVDEIQIDGKKIECISSDSYARKVLMDFVFQTVLLLTFSLLIFIEYQIYSNNNRTNDKAVRDGTN